MEDRNTLIGQPGPFQIIEVLGASDCDLPGAAPRRRYECDNYDTCLELAAALNWDSFTCRGCNQAISQPLLWRAHQARKKDQVAESICEHLPEIGVYKAAPSVDHQDKTCEDGTPLSDMIDLKA